MTTRGNRGTERGVMPCSTFLNWGGDTRTLDAETAKTRTAAEQSLYTLENIRRTQRCFSLPATEYSSKFLETTYLEKTTFADIVILRQTIIEKLNISCSAETGP